jgi:type I restriction enzyme S subunit
MTPQELKNSILQLAIQGRLVEQRREEGTGASEIQKMLQDKQRLISTCAIKKEKCFSDVSDEEKRYDIPETWAWIRIGNVGSWSAGATPSRTISGYYNGNIPWLKTGDLNDGFISDVPESISELALEKTSVRLNPAGSVLMAMYGATIGKLGILKTPMTTNQACCACIPFEGIYNKFLFYFLMGNRPNFIKMGEGGAQPNISKDKIVNYPLALPPLAEQKRIVAKIEELLPYIDRYEKAWSKLEAFNKRFPLDMQKSILQTAIQGKLVEQRPEEGTAEELYQQIQAEKQELIKAKKIKKEKPLPEITEDEMPFEIPENWKITRFGNVISLLSGTDFRPEDYNDNRKGTVYITGASCLSDTGVLELRWTETPRIIAEKGDVLLVCKGSGYGKTVICDVEKAHIARQIMAIQKTSLLDMNYIRYYLMSNIALIRGKGQGVIPGIDRGSVLNMAFPLPPLAEQKRIVAKLEELLPLCERLK